MMSGPPFDHTIKFLCSYGGKILPRYSDGKLRYVGGHTRVLAVHRSISFPELLLKLEVLCGTTVSLRCQLPTEDLDALVSIKSDDDLAHLIEECDLGYNRSSLKIRAFLLAPRSGLQHGTSSSSSDTSSPKSFGSTSSSMFSVRMATPVVDRCNCHAPVMAFPVRPARKVARYPYDHNGNLSSVYLVPSASRTHWQYQT